jgi:hypothetical protein
LALFSRSAKPPLSADFAHSSAILMDLAFSAAKAQKFDPYGINNWFFSRIRHYAPQMVGFAARKFSFLSLRIC